MSGSTSGDQTSSWGLVGVPSSAAAHWPGIEKAPEAFRAAGLVAKFREKGVPVSDHGDLPVVRWRSHRLDDGPNNVQQVLSVLRDVDHAVGTVIDDRQRPLVLGGECTVVIGVISAFVRRGIDVGLVYVDGGQDLMIPADHIDEPILDGMGVAHLLGLDGVVDDIAGVGSRRPLLDPARVTFVGYSDAEEDIHGLVPSARFPASLVAESPEATAAAAIVAVTTQAEKYVVHVDVDVLDFLDIPAADVPSYGRGLTLAQLRSLLGPLAADPRCVAITFVEHNPDHGSPDGSTTRALADAMVDALAVGRHRYGRPASPQMS